MQVRRVKNIILNLTEHLLHLSVVDVKGSSTGKLQNVFSTRCFTRLIVYIDTVLSKRRLAVAEPKLSRISGAFETHFKFS